MSDPTPFEDLDLEADIGSIQLSSPRAGVPAPQVFSSRINPLVNEEERDHLGVHSMADCFLQFLESLSEPVITFAAYPNALRAERRADAYRVVESLPLIVRILKILKLMKPC